MKKLISNLVNEINHLLHEMEYKIAMLEDDTLSLDELKQLRLDIVDANDRLEALKSKYLELIETYERKL